MSTDSLVQRSTCVTPVQIADSDTHFWLSAERVLLLRLAETPPDGWRGPSLLPRALATPHYDACVLDLPAGTGRPASVFNSKHAEELVASVMCVHAVDGSLRPIAPPEADYEPPACAVSSSGKWLLWRREDEWRAAALDGSDDARWPAPDSDEDTQAAWLSNTLKWAEVGMLATDDGHARALIVLHRANDVSYERRIAVSGLEAGEVAGQTATGSLLFVHPARGRAHGLAQTVRLSQVDLKERQTSAWSHEINLPFDADDAEVVLSPDGQRLAWVTHRCGYQGTPPLSDVWVCGLDGHHVEIVGTTRDVESPPEPGSAVTHLSWPTQLRWRPDGAAVSFVLGRKLRVAPLA